MSLALAKDANGVFYHPRDVKNPLLSIGALFCPICSCEVISKVNGTIRVPHFAHKSNTSSCPGGGEEMIHCLAKEFINENISSCSIFNTCNRCSKSIEYSHPKDHTCVMGTNVGGRRVDVAVFDGTGKINTCIEVFDTHHLDERKLHDLYENMLCDVFEIDARKVLSGERILVSNLPCRKCMHVMDSVNNVKRHEASVSNQAIDDDAKTRESFVNMDITPGKVTIVQGTAGSGKTTLLESFITKNPDSRFLYLCYNKNLKDEIYSRFCTKYFHVDVTNFDSLWYRLYRPHHDNEKQLHDFLMEYSEEMNLYLDGVSIDTFKGPVQKWIREQMEKDWWTFKKRAWNIYKDPEKYSVLQAFEGYDVIILDEAQDMQPMTANIIRELTGDRVHLIYAGDPDQQLYGFAGAIDAMKDLGPDDLFTLNKTFRFGVDVCSYVNEAIVNRYTNVSDLNRNTPVIDANQFLGMGEMSYTYLFRSVAEMVQKAEKAVNDGKKVCIDFKNRVSALRQEKYAMDRAKKLGHKIYLNNDTQSWLGKLNKNKLDQLEKLFDENESVVSEHETTFSTVHKFKGKEDDIVRVNSDVILDNERCIRNVGLTRARYLLVLDYADFCHPMRKKKRMVF